MFADIIKNPLDVLRIGCLSEVGKDAAVVWVRVHAHEHRKNELLCCIDITRWPYIVT